MSFFYTSVDLHFDNILFRGYKNGKRIKENIKYSPTLFLESKEKTNFKTLNNRFVTPKKFKKISDAREFTKQYNDIGNFKIYGNQNYIHQFISDL